MHVTWKNTPAHLHVERRIEGHLQVTLIVLVEHAQETLLEDGRRERIGQNDNAVRGVGHRLHL